MQIYNRADIVNFMKVEDSYIRMQGFTDGGRTLNSETYERRYIDERNSRSDVTGYSPEIAYTFDRIKDNKVHDLIANIHDKELVGQTVEILTVNFNEGDATKGYTARTRKYSVIPDSDGDNTDAYTYSGAFKANGDIVEGEATTEDDWKSCKFASATSETSVQNEEDETGTGE